MLEWILGSSFAIALISFVGIISLAINDKILDKILLILVGLSAGAFMGGAFLHLLPEAVEQMPGTGAFVLALFGFCVFLAIEKILHWHHCHSGKCEQHSLSYMILLGDGFHNFIDGLILAASFLISFKLGVTTFFAIALHEIPQEIGDFGVLVYGGFSRMKALLFNFISALTVIAGGLVGYFVAGQIEGFGVSLIPFTAGSFMYIAASGLIPEIKKETSWKKSVAALGAFAVGISLMYLFKIMSS